MSTKRDRGRIALLDGTAAGRKQLQRETNRWDRLTEAIARILRPAIQE